MLKPSNKPALALMFLALGGLSGCVADAQMPRELAMPEHYQMAPVAHSAADAQALAQWWQQFNDPLLTQLVERATQRNFNVLQALKQVSRARQRSDLIDSTRWPKLGVGASWHDADVSDDNALLGQLGVGDLDFSYAQEGLQASWATDLFGATRQQLAASRFAEQASEAEVYGSQLMVATTVARAYIQLRGLQQQQQILTEALQITEQFSSIYQQLMASGDAQREDIQQVQTSLAGLQAQQANVEQGVAQAQLTLEQLCRIAPGQLASMLTPQAKLPALSPLVQTGQPVDLLLRRPDLMALRAQTNAALATTAAARRALWPQLDISAMLGRYQWSFSDSRLDSHGDIGAVGAMFSLPLLDFGTRRARIEQTDTLAQQAMLRYQQHIWQALFEVEEALSAQHHAQQRVRALQHQFAVRSQQQQVVEQRLAVGDVGRPQVLQARQQTLTAKQALVNGQVALLDIQLQLYQALGGGWQIVKPDAKEAEHIAPWLLP